MNDAQAGTCRLTVPLWGDCHLRDRHLRDRHLRNSLFVVIVGLHVGHFHCMPADLLMRDSVSCYRMLKTGWLLRPKQKYIMSYFYYLKKVGHFCFLPQMKLTAMGKVNHPETSLLGMKAQSDVKCLLRVPEIPISPQALHPGQTHICAGKSHFWKTQTPATIGPQTDLLQ